MRGAVLSAGDQRGDVIGQLQGGVKLICLTVGRPRSLIAAALVGGLTAGFLADLNAGRLTETQSGVVFVQGVQPHAVAHLHKIVAGIGDGGGGVDLAVAAVLPAPGTAVPCGAGVLPVAGIEQSFRGGSGAGFQRGHSSGGLQGGAGGVGAGGGAVEHGGGGVRGKLGIVLPPCGKVKGGVGGKRENLAGTHLDHGGGRAPAVQPILGVQGFHGGGQSVLHRLLKVQVYRQLHGVAGAGLYAIVFAGDLPVAVDGDHLLSIRAPEVLLKGGLHAGEADGIVHFVALCLQLVRIVGNTAHRAENMGGVGGAVGPGGGADDAGAAEVTVADKGAEGDIHILR